MSQIHINESDVVSFEDSFNEMEWDNILFIDSYRLGTEINNILGYKWTHEKMVNPYDHDNTILFLSGGKVIGSIYLKGKLLDIQLKILSKPDARFKIGRTSEEGSSNFLTIQEVTL